jgi:hypothetical protein
VTAAAILTMITTMGIVTGFAVYFFFKILNTPQRKDGEE